MARKRKGAERLSRRPPVASLTDYFGSGTDSSCWTLRLRIADKPGMFGRVTSRIGKFQVDIDAVDMVGQEEGFVVRDITIIVPSFEQGQAMLDALRRMHGVSIVHVSDRVFRLHLGGKLKMGGRVPINNNRQLFGDVYTPRVAQVCEAIAANPEKAWALTQKGSTVLVVTNGTRVLALGDIGPKAAMPVMEGKAMLFAEFGGVNAVQLSLDARDPETFITVVKAVAPNFGFINLEDIQSPDCWEIERRLKTEFDIPVFHDDQHGTAVVVLAATLNALEIVNKRLSEIKVVASGVGAAGMACSKLLIAAGCKNIIGFNKGGAVYHGRSSLNDQEKWLAANSNPGNFSGTLKQAMSGADLFIGLSVPGVIDGKDVARMNRDAIVFALANPTPEILPEQALRNGARIAGTGSSNYPNQINNSLVFPGIARGALHARVREITDEMKIEAARALAAVIPLGSLREEYIIADMFNPAAHNAVADAIVRVAQHQGHARRTLRKR